MRSDAELASSSLVARYLLSDPPLPSMPGYSSDISNRKMQVTPPAAVSSTSDESADNKGVDDNSGREDNSNDSGRTPYQNPPEVDGLLSQALHEWSSDQNICGSNDSTRITPDSDELDHARRSLLAEFDQATPDQGVFVNSSIHKGNLQQSCQRQNYKKQQSGEAINHQQTLTGLSSLQQNRLECSANKTDQLQHNRHLYNSCSSSENMSNYQQVTNHLQSLCQQEPGSNNNSPEIHMSLDDQEENTPDDITYVTRADCTDVSEPRENISDTDLNNRKEKLLNTNTNNEDITTLEDVNSKTPNVQSMVTINGEVNNNIYSSNINENSNDLDSSESSNLPHKSDDHNYFKKADDKPRLSSLSFHGSEFSEVLTPKLANNAVINKPLTLHTVTKNVPKVDSPQITLPVSQLNHITSTASTESEVHKCVLQNSSSLISNALTNDSSKNTNKSDAESCHSYPYKEKSNPHRICSTDTSTVAEVPGLQATLPNPAQVKETLSASSPQIVNPAVQVITKPAQLKPISSVLIPIFVQTALGTGDVPSFRQAFLINRPKETASTCFTASNNTPRKFTPIAPKLNSSQLSTSTVIKVVDGKYSTVNKRPQCSVSSNMGAVSEPMQSINTSSNSTVLLVNKPIPVKEQVSTDPPTIHSTLLDERNIHTSGSESLSEGRCNLISLSANTENHWHKEQKSNNDNISHKEKHSSNVTPGSFSENVSPTLKSHDALDFKTQMYSSTTPNNTASPLDQERELAECRLTHHDEYQASRNSCGNRCLSNTNFIVPVNIDRTTENMSRFVQRDKQDIFRKSSGMTHKDISPKTSQEISQSRHASRDLLVTEFGTKLFSPVTVRENGQIHADVSSATVNQSSLGRSDCGLNNIKDKNVSSASLLSGSPATHSSTDKRPTFAVDGEFDNYQIQNSPALLKRFSATCQESSSKTGVGCQRISTDLLQSPSGSQRNPYADTAQEVVPKSRDTFGNCENTICGSYTIGPHQGDNSHQGFQQQKAPILFSSEPSSNCLSFSTHRKRAYTFSGDETFPNSFISPQKKYGTKKDEEMASVKCTPKVSHSSSILDPSETKHEDILTAALKCTGPVDREFLLARRRCATFSAQRSNRSHDTHVHVENKVASNKDLHLALYSDSTSRMEPQSNSVTEPEFSINRPAQNGRELRDYSENSKGPRNKTIEEKRKLGHSEFLYGEKDHVATTNFTLKEKSPTHSMFGRLDYPYDHTDTNRVRYSPHTSVTPDDTLSPPNSQTVCIRQDYLSHNFPENHTHRNTEESISLSRNLMLGLSPIKNRVSKLNCMLQSEIEQNGHESLLHADELNYPRCIGLYSEKQLFSDSPTDMHMISTEGNREALAFQQEERLCPPHPQVQEENQPLNLCLSACPDFSQIKNHNTTNINSSEPLNLTTKTSHRYPDFSAASCESCPHNQRIGPPVHSGQLQHHFPAHHPYILERDLWPKESCQESHLPSMNYPHAVYSSIYTRNCPVPTSSDQISRGRSFSVTSRMSSLTLDQSDHPGKYDTQPITREECEDKGDDTVRLDTDGEVVWRPWSSRFS